jgi:hypothetical protein
VDDRTALGQLDACLAAYEPGIQALMHHGLDRLDAVLPGAVRMVYDNWNATVVGYTPDGRARQAACSLAAYPRWVNLFFFVGDALGDPRLRGSGSTVRSLRLVAPDDIDDAACALVRKAAALGDWHPEPRAEVTTVIAAISERRKPRRPAG